MTSDPVIPITAAVALVGICVVYWIFRRTHRGADVKSPRGVFETQCSVCRRTLVINRSELAPLSPAETGLVVSALPKVQGRKLAAYSCTYCKAEHTFALDTTPPEWLIANAFTPHTNVARCTQCNIALKAPPWHKDAYAGRVTEAPGLLPEHGLICSRCGASTCFACAVEVTRNRTKDGSLLCPRCFRGPVDRFVSQA